MQIYLCIDLGTPIGNPEPLLVSNNANYAACWQTNICSSFYTEHAAQQHRICEITK